MFRYIALIWNVFDAGQCARAKRVEERIAVHRADLKRVFAARGISVFFAGGPTGAFGVYALPGAAGVVVGRLFHGAAGSSTSPGGAVALDESDVTALRNDRAQTFQRKYWGRYLAVTSNAAGNGALVLPDPTGETPCFFMEDRGATCVFSNAGDIAALGLVNLSINWRYLAAALYQSDLQVEETGLDRVSQLLSGEGLQVSAGQRKRFLCWNLFELAASRRIEDAEDAVRLTRTTVRACVQAWAACYPRIAHMLSGGIDSSIVLACLLDSPIQREIRCLNVYDPRVGGNELDFARLAVGEMGTRSGRRSELIECERTVEGVQLQLLSQVSLEAYPESYLSEAAYRQFYVRAADRADSVLFTGLGGDYIFSRTSSARPAADHVRDHGITPQLWKVLRDHTGQRTYWSTLWEALRIGLSNRDIGLPRAPAERACVHPDVLHHFDEEGSGYLQSRWARLHPPATSVPPSKRHHIAAMYCPVRRNDPLDVTSRLNWCSPLLSQPIMELHARIPVYLLRRGGVERAVARRAFRSDLPRAVLQRRSKSVTNHFLHEVLRRYQTFFQETLLEGIMTRERLLDRRQVEQFFKDAHDGYTEGFSQVIGSFIDMELWLRRWHGEQQQWHARIEGGAD